MSTHDCPCCKCEEIKTQRWCPTCCYFFKDFGQNNCRKVDWGLNPEQDSRNSIIRWLDYNTGSGESTRINDDADSCPGWESYESKTDAWYVEANRLLGIIIRKGAHHLYRVGSVEEAQKEHHKLVWGF